MIEFPPDEPKYLVIVREIRRRIAAGEWKPRQRVPGEPGLADEFDVSRGTARRALDILISEGDLYTVIGKGTFVSPKDGRDTGQDRTG